MPNKTIYVSQGDAPIFEQAQQIAGEALSSVIARALREYVARHQERDKSMKEVSVRVGPRKSPREQRFTATYVGKWKGLSDDRAWWLEAAIYHTQKGNWAVYLDHKGPAMLTKKSWQDFSYMEDTRYSEMVVAGKPDEFAGRLPKALVAYIENLARAENNPVDYLDI